MKLPNFRRVFKTDYPQEQQPLVEKLSVTLNNGFEVVYNAMARNVSLADNIFCTIRTAPVKVDASGNPLSPFSFKLDTTGVIKGMQVIKASNLTNSSVYPTGTPFITYTQDNTQINVVNIAGLPANNNFELTIIAWG